MPKQEDSFVSMDLGNTIVTTNEQKLDCICLEQLWRGDAGNSGGPHYVGLERSDEAPFEPVDVVKLRNNSVTPPTPTSER